jgi:hypothetical protein
MPGHQGPGKKSTKAMKQYTKRRLSRKPKIARNSAATDSKCRERYVYDGQRLLGTFIENERAGLVLAWDPLGRFLGRFRDPKEAANAISEAARAAEARKAATAKALDRLNRPVGFVTGLPSHFLGRRA